MTAANPIAAVILAAGQSRRMGTPKLLIEIGGKSLIERCADAALAARTRPVIVVTGSGGAEIRARLGARPLLIVDNPAFAAGLSTSLRCGIDAVPTTAAGVLILLPDMPGIDPLLIDQLVAAFAPERGRDIVVPTRQGRRGNPVLWGRRYFSALRGISGDIGGRSLLAAASGSVREIEADDDGVLIDLDTPADVQAWRRGDS
jgi:molybdenum cofactor cytidylyltransferase